MDCDLMSSFTIFVVKYLKRRSETNCNPILPDICPPDPWSAPPSASCPYWASCTPSPALWCEHEGCRSTPFCITKNKKLISSPITKSEIFVLFLTCSYIMKSSFKKEELEPSGSSQGDSSGSSGLLDLLSLPLLRQLFLGRSPSLLFSL